MSKGIRTEKATGPVTMYGKPYDLGKIGRGSWEREKKQGERSQFINSYVSLAQDRE